ncbi:MAG: 4-hydroxy-3-methylbut-2-enyl diphosphate reductase [Lentisphaeria bacterium]|nr:4-hydroxy-3-methylbut-2-enyl diphosphate reductase [Lentisphaeria bacterium]MBR4076613.1 4-hydroxy-3-methylbut-2-enyl diphosphate reductase [Lentisphaeria bacterium]
MKIYLAAKRGFCAGVNRAVETALEQLHRPENGPVRILHELVHNKTVVESLKKHGCEIVENADDAPAGSILIFSAHGVSEDVETHAKSLPLTVFDATCPLVKQVQNLAAQRSAAGDVILLAGKKNHREVEGILGRIPGEKYLLTSPADAENFSPASGKAYTLLSQTTFFEEDFEKIVQILQEKISLLQIKNTICPSTSARQDAVRRMAAVCDIVIVVGTPNSSNSKRLCEAAISAGAKSLLLSGTSDLPESLWNVRTIGVTSGASASEEEVQQLLQRLLTLPGAEFAGELK